jgi:glycosyltransferase involved in cell wall biosynthesis
VTRVVFVSGEPVGEKMSGPAIRTVELARVVAEAGCEVTIAAPATDGFKDPDIALIEANQRDYERLLAAAKNHDVLVAERLPPHLLHTVAGLDTRYVADLYNPIVIETTERNRARTAGSQRRRAAIVTAHTIANLACADFMLCASERQRDHWLGMLAGHNLIDRDLYDGDRGLRQLIDVVPSGLPTEPPKATEPLLRSHPEVGPDDRILVWGGGIWPWLDALTPIRTIERLADREPAIHLHFPAIDRPQALSAAEMSNAHQAVAYAEERGLLGQRVHIGNGWVPYDERAGYLVEADLGITAHHAHLEAHYAFRSRILDYFWAGLPVVATRGDVLSDLIEREHVGRTVAPGDDRAFAAACEALLDDSEARAAAGAAARRIAEAHRWNVVAAPLVDYCLDYAARPRARRPRTLIARSVVSLYPDMLMTEFEDNGLGGVARKLSRNVASTLGLRGHANRI